MKLPAPLTRVALPMGQCWLWRDGDEVTLVDTGPAGSGPRIAAALAALGLDRDAVVRVVLTHFHDDHAGSAAEIRAWSGAEVVVHAADAPIVRGKVTGPGRDLLAAEVELMAQVAAGLPPAPPCPVDLDVDVDIACVGHGEPVGRVGLAAAVPGPFAGPPEPGRG